MRTKGNSLAKFHLFGLMMVATVLAGRLQSTATPQGLPPAPDAREKKGVVLTEAQLGEIVSHVAPAAASELHRRGASITFVDMVGMSGWDARQLAWIARELPRRVGAELEKAGFTISKNYAVQSTPSPETNTNVPLVKSYDLRPVPDLVVVLSVSLTSSPGTVAMCVQPPSEFLSSRSCEHRQSFEIR